MKRLSVLTFAAMAVMATPAVAEPGSQASDQSTRFRPSRASSDEPPTQVERRGFSFPVDRISRS